MWNGRLVNVSPRHRLTLASELCPLLDKAPQKDFVVRTIAHREANGMPLMTADIVIASAETRSRYPGADAYPLHFRKRYYPGRMHGEPKDEFDNQARAHALINVPPPIGYADKEFRTCMIPGRPLSTLADFTISPVERNIERAQNMSLAELAGNWRLCEAMYDQLSALHAGGMRHGDAEIHNCVVCPSPLEALLIDFEGASGRRTDETEAQWQSQCREDLSPLLRQAVFLQTGLGAQDSQLGQLSRGQIADLFEQTDVFEKAIARAAGV